MLFLCVVIIFVTSYLVLSFQAYTTVVVQLMALLWFHALCRWLLRRFGTTYFLHLQGDWHHLESFTLNMETTPPKRRNSRLQAGAETQKRTINVEISLNNNHKHNYVFMTVVHTYFYIVTYKSFMSRMMTLLYLLIWILFSPCAISCEFLVVFWSYLTKTKQMKR